MACAHHAETGKKTRYACADGAELIVYFSQDGRSAIIALEGGDAALTLSPDSTGGGRYEGSDYTLYAFRDQASLDFQDARVRVGCRAASPEPLIEKPQFPRLDFHKMIPGKEED